MRIRILIASIGLVSTATGIVQAREDWIICSTPKTQYVLHVPTVLVRSTAPGAIGCSFQTTDGEFNVEAVVQPAAGETVEARMQKESDLLGGKVRTKKKGDTWFALSGVTADGTEYYRKVYNKDAQWVSLRITYPHARHKKYSKWVKHMQKTFAPFGEKKGD